MRNLSLAAVAAGACAVAFAQPDVPDGESTVATSPGTHQLTLPGNGRRYTLSIPEGYTGEEPVPLVLSLHYGGEVTAWHGRGLLDTLIAPALRELGAVIVAPDSAARGWVNSEAERHVLELLDHVTAHLNIDTERMLITGYSMGGMGTWYLAPRHAERFAAAIPMAGRPGSDIASMDWRIPTYVIHSAADELIPLEPTASAVEVLRAQGAPIELVVAEGITHFEMARFQPHLAAAVPWIRQVWAAAR
jgi:predicted peptidase